LIFYIDESFLNNTMHENLSLLYESILISEMTEKVVNYVQKHTEDLPFDSIFGDKLRIIIPVKTSSIVGDILNDLKKINGFSSIDPMKGEILRKIKIDPKYGQGEEKIQTVNIGKAIQSLKIDPEKKKEYMSWYAKYKDSLPQEMKKTSDHSIILTRAPVDVVRMSDHRNISSCHSQGDSHFQCAVQEALTGGAVAYLVNSDTLESYIDSDDFQMDDLFDDRERGRRGLEPPVARLRIRRYIIDGVEYALPEKQIYGNLKIPGFFKSVRDFLDGKQDLGSIDFNEKDIEIRGGSYEDNDSQYLINAYFGRDSERGDNLGDIDMVDQYEEDDRDIDGIYGWEEEMHELVSNYESRLNYASVGADYDNHPDGGGAYVMAWGEITFDMSGHDLPEDIEELEQAEAYDIYRVKKYDNGVMWWSSFISSVDSDLTSLGDAEYTINFNDQYQLTFLYKEVLYDEDSLDTFFNNIRYLDISYQKYEDDIYQSMLQSLPDMEEVEEDGIELEEVEEDGIELEKFDIEVGYSASKAECNITCYTKSEDYDFMRDLEKHFKSIPPYYVNRCFHKFVSDIHKPIQKSGEQMEFKKFFESFNNSFDLNEYVRSFTLLNIDLRAGYFTVKLEVVSRSNDKMFMEILQSMEGNFKYVELFIFYIIMSKFWGDVDMKSTYSDLHNQMSPDMLKLQRIFLKYRKF